MTNKKTQIVTELSLLPPFMSEETPLLAVPIRSVTVTEDRAEVTRISQLRYHRGVNRVFIPNITIYVADDSLLCRIVPESGIQTGGVRTIRWYRAPGGDYRRREQDFLTQLDTLAMAFNNLLDSHSRHGLNRTAFEKAIIEARESINREIIHQGILPRKWQSRFEALIEHMKDLQKGSCTWRTEMVDLLEKINVLTGESEEEPALISRLAGVLVHFSASADGEGEMTLCYEVPCTQWRPLHEARLVSGPPEQDRIELTTMGVVWQKTGEDWNNIELSLSTARPSLGLTMPIPEDDWLQSRTKTAEERKTIHASIRDQAIVDTGQTQSAVLPVPDDGGQTQHYKAQGLRTILADGNPTIVELQRQTIEGTSSLVACPELSDRVFLRSRVTAGQTPILAGPVELYRQGGYVGRGSLEYVGAHGPFFLWWGSEDFLHLVRTVETHDEEAGLLTKARKFTKVRVLARNLGGNRTSISLTERVPISEIPHVSVELDETPDNIKPDRDGFVVVPLVLGPGEERECVVAWHLVLDKNVRM